MKPVDQTVLHVPGVSKGNCQQAAVASILHLDIDEVPNFVESDNFWNDFHVFMKSKGYEVVSLEPHRSPLCYYLAYGKTERGTRHACVYWGGQLVHDPHPSKAGLMEVDEINLIVPIEIF